jgi:signal transduction histidine kinase/ActR/RegA family two-component response regulator
MKYDQIDVPHEGATSEAWRRGLASAVALLAALLLIALVILVAQSNHERDVALERERHSYDILVITRTLDASMARAEAALGRFVISGEKTTGTQYYDEWRRAGRQIRQLTVMTADDPVQAALVRDLNQLYAQRGLELAEPAAHANFRQGWQALSLFNEAGKATSIPRIARILAQLASNERRVLGMRSVVAARAADWSNFLAAMLSVLGALLAIGSIALGWMTVQAVAHRRAARRAAMLESERAETLEQAVADRTRELITANERLREEAATRALAEAQLRQVQKMEAVGQLTGGIAHDFNNMLAVVVGGLDLARRRLGHETAEVGRHIDNAMEGATRAAALTRRLLAFARAEPLLPEGVDPGQLITGMSDLLDRTLGERIKVRTETLDRPWNVWVDPHQLENAILNLAVNARDAMENEGCLTISIANLTLRRHEIGEAEAGDYVRIDVTDDGCGMSPEVLDRVFEPFFTTKPIGKGTGLGLSQLFGFARQSGGEVAIRSAPGEGTTVSLYLPRFVYAAGEQPRTKERLFHETAVDAPADARGATILVVEDDMRVRVSTVGALEELGYVPVPCGSAEEAIEVLGKRDDVRLIITDVVMPGMTGPELIGTIAPRYPHIAVLFVTGYVGDAGEAEQFAGYEVLRKPFTVNALSKAVADAIGRAARATERAA